MWFSNHLLKADKITLCPKVIALFEEANGLIEKLKIDLTFQEEQFVKQLLDARVIPYPKLLIKDHKTINKKG